MPRAEQLTTLQQMEPSKSQSRGIPIERIQGLDLLKAFAALAIVWIHTPESRGAQHSIGWSRFAVPAFTCVSLLFLFLKLRQKTFWLGVHYILTRAGRLYVVFLCWNCIYLLARILKHSFVATGDPIRLDLSTLLVVGFAEHLWFVPFICACWMVLGSLFLLGSRAEPMGLNMSVLAATVLAICIAGSNCPTEVDLDTSTLSYFAVLAWNAFPSALLALPALLLFVYRTRTTYFLALFWITLGFFCLFSSFGPTRGSLWHSFSGLCFVSAGLFWPPSKLLARFSPLGDLLLPVYLVHVLFIEAIQTAAHRMQLPESGTVGPDDILRGRGREQPGCIKLEAESLALLAGRHAQSAWH